MSCSNNKIKGIGDVIGKEIICDSILNNEKYKILVINNDTTDCISCKLQVNKWYIYNLELEKLNLNCDVIYVLNNDIIEKEIIHILKNYNLKSYCIYNKFIQDNLFISDFPYNTFLLSDDNKILLIGDPINNKKLWKLYKEKIERPML